LGQVSGRHLKRAWNWPAGLKKPKQRLRLCRQILLALVASEVAGFVGMNSALPGFYWSSTASQVGPQNVQFEA
jgi:hypothetical protein